MSVPPLKAILTKGKIMSFLTTLAKTIPKKYEKKCIRYLKKKKNLGFAILERIYTLLVHKDLIYYSGYKQEIWNPPMVNHG